MIDDLPLFGPDAADAAREPFAPASARPSSVRLGCPFCGGDRHAPDHAARCDGRQGRVDAADVRGMVRADDHATSVDAAEVVAEHVNALQERVIVAFRARGPMTDELLEALPEFEGYAYSTVRKRRTELYQRGVLVVVGDSRNSRGRRMLLWGLAS